MINAREFDNCEVQSFVNEIKSECLNLSEQDRKEALMTLFGCIDNTTLNGSDTPFSVAEFCKLTKSTVVPSTAGPLQVASVCVYPCFVGLAKKVLDNSGIRVAAVAGGFPAGQIPQRLKVEETQYVVGEGADEVDMVINRGLFLSGDEDAVSDEIAAVKAACGASVKLKVIIECGELQTLENIYRASILALEAGADFIKTSTGKIAVGATPESAFAMLSALRDFRKKTSKEVGFKAAGGVSTPDDALLYLMIFKKMLNIQNVSNHIFRIGTSRLTFQLSNILTV